MSLSRNLLLPSALATTLALSAAMIGCERDGGASVSSQPPPASTKQPATRPAGEFAAEVADAGVVSARKPVVGPPSFLYITEMPEGEVSSDAQTTAPVSYRFPAARLRISSKPDEAVTALLFSDDPKEAINKDWTGDRYYFSLTFQQNMDPRHLDGAVWYCQASESEKEETGNGIFLHGDQAHLEPLRAMISCEGEGSRLRVRVSGEFLQYDMSTPEAKPRHCQVTGVLAPRVEIK